MTPYNLWESEVPGAQGTSPEDTPTLAHYPGKSGAAAVIVCPGGGYGMLADHEGAPVAEWLNSVGLHAFVLQYRLGPKYHAPEIPADALQAVRQVRKDRAKFDVGNQIGILGFSAGGHLAATVVVKGQAGDGSRPDFGILIYPVIALEGPAAHVGSRDNLLGEDPWRAEIEAYSPQRHVSHDTPPCFLIHAADDEPVPVANSLMMASALAENNVPFELHVFPTGGHGFGLGNPNTELDWRNLAADWIRRTCK